MLFTLVGWLNLVYHAPIILQLYPIQKRLVCQVCNRSATGLFVTDLYLKMPLVSNIICYISATCLLQMSHHYVIILDFTDAVQCIDSSVATYLQPSHNYIQICNIFVFLYGICCQFFTSYASYLTTENPQKLWKLSPTKLLHN